MLTVVGMRYCLRRSTTGGTIPKQDNFYVDFYYYIYDLCTYFVRSANITYLCCGREVPKQVGKNSHTHDWEVWLRGVSDKTGKRDKIENFIDKVRRANTLHCVTVFMQ